MTDQDNLFAAMRKFGLRINDPDAEYWPELFGYIRRSDAALSIFTEERRARLADLFVRKESLSPREAAFVIGAFMEALGVANAETGAAQ